MRQLGRCEEPLALAKKIGAVIKNFNSAELNRFDVLFNLREMWSKVRHLTGRSNMSKVPSQNSRITTDELNDHHATLSSDLN